MDTKNILGFLTELSAHNTTEWMHAHKPEYDRAKAQFEEFVQSLLNRLAASEPRLKTLSPKDCIFRINRDIRFTKDKSPYKDHFAAFIAEGGRKSDRAGYYVHLQPHNQTIIGGGIYCPDNKTALTAIRRELSANGGELQKILAAKSFKSAYPAGMEGDSLIKAPLGFASDDPYINYIKMKSFIVSRLYDDGVVVDGDKFVDEVVSKLNLLKPYNDFFNAAFE